MLDVITQAQDLLQLLRARRVVVPDAVAVQDYLAGHPDLAAVVLRVADLLQRDFGAAEQVALELYRDQDVADEYLTYYVRSPSYTDDSIMSRIRKLWTEYGADLMDKSGWLLVTTDFDEPVPTDAV